MRCLLLRSNSVVLVWTILLLLFGVNNYSVEGAEIVCRKLNDMATCVQSKCQWCENGEAWKLEDDKVAKDRRRTSRQLESQSFPPVPTCQLIGDLCLSGLSFVNNPSLLLTAGIILIFTKLN